MNLLSDEEINAIWSEPLDRSTLSPFGLSRIHSIIAAAIGKLAQGVSVEPSAYRFTENRGNGNTEFNYYGLDEVGMAYRDNCLEITPLYTATAIAAARVQALEDAAALAEYENAADWSISGQIARQIRALKDAR